jgi:hypothetical protein
MRAERMAARLKLAPQLHVVEDLAVEADPEAAVGIGQRLMPRGRQVHDAQPPVREAYASIGIDARIVGAAMRDRIGHPSENDARARLTPGKGIGQGKETRDSAHANRE